MYLEVPRWVHQPIRQFQVTRAFLLLLPAATAAGGCSKSTVAIQVEPDAGYQDPMRIGPQLRSRLNAAVAERGAGYVPRTRHLTPDGKPRYTNRLVLESSPYLLQHAHNPVNWFAWGDEPFRIARELGRPVFLSVGYSTCHWCHVMEEESFEDEEVATMLNEHYVPIKVDREERPDVDAVYMTAVQAITGQGGWPMSVWLTPSRQPYFAGTYFPARDGDRGTHAGFLTLLAELLREYESDGDSVAVQAEQIADAVRQLMSSSASEPVDARLVLERADKIATRQFDEAWGGVRGAPKFPSSFPSRLLLRRHYRTGQAASLQMALHTLRRMAEGGMHDQVGGGFHRYSVDRHWLVPHFEKMLYDNALLTQAYLDGYQASGDDGLARVAQRILDYVGREMTAPNGGFYSATDADSVTPTGEREEGYYFTWTPAELDAALGSERAKLATDYFGATAAGNFEGRSILHAPESPNAVAACLGLQPQKLEARVAQLRDQLLAARQQRPPPLRDEKIQTSWNGLMIGALARGAQVLGEPRYAQGASRAAERLLLGLRPEGRLAHNLTDGRLRGPAFADDYAFLAAGLVDLFEATQELRWLREAMALMQVLEREYADRAHGGYFLTANDHERLLAREKPGHDGATPSANSVALLTLLRLAEITEDAAWHRRADRTLRAFGTDVRARPHAFSEMLLGVDFWLGPVKQIAIVVPDGSGPPLAMAEPFLQILNRTFLPNRVVAVSSQSELHARAEIIPWLRRRTAKNGRPTAYLCEQGRCQLPTTDPAEFGRQLRNGTIRIVE